MEKLTYVELMKKHQQELTDFPIAYAFNDQQLKEALVKLGVDDISECVTVFEHGDIVKRENAPKLIEMMKRHNRELKESLKDEEFAESAFLYEMDNHEYAINWSADEDVLNCFNLTFKELKEMNLADAYNRARNKHMKHAEEWGMI